MNVNWPTLIGGDDLLDLFAARLRRRTVAFGTGTELLSTAVPLMSACPPFR